MAMVGNSPVSQTATRSWTGPATSPPAETDDSIAHANHVQTNHHGAIGEHRRSSRSSSVSSGGSSGNNTDLTKDTAEKDNTGLNPHNAPDPQGQTQSRMPKSAATASTELVSQINPLPTPASDGSDSLSLSFALSARAMGASPQANQFQPMGGTSKIGRPITGTSSSPFPGSQSSTSDHELSNLMAEAAALPTGFGAPQLDFDNGQDVFSLASMESTLMSQQNSASTLAPVGSAFATLKPITNNCGPFQFRNSPPYYNQSNSNGQYQNMAGAYANSSKQAMSMNTGGYMGNQQNNFSHSSTGAYYHGLNSGSSNGRQSNGSLFSNARSNMAAASFSNQDYSMPPPTQPWQPYNTQNHGQGQNQSGGTDMKKMTCDSCSQLYRWPQILDCLHVFCFNCIAQRADENAQTVVCQKCNHITGIPEGPCNLRLDLQVCGEMSALNLPVFGCTMCPREGDAAISCDGCPAFLCLDCYDRHKLMIHFDGHLIRPITKLVMFKGEYRPTCAKHSNHPEDKWCVSCEKMICDECIAEHVHPNMPAGNNYDLEEAFNIIAPRLQNWNEDAFIKFQDIIEIIKRFPDLQTNMDVRKRHVKRLIDEYADYIKNVVEQCRASAMEEVEQAHAQMEAKVQSLIKTFADLAAGLEGMSKFNSRTLDDGNIAYVMKNLSVMEMTYKRLITMYSETLKCSEGITVDFKFNPNYPGTSELLHDNFLNIAYKINDVDYKVQPNSQPLRSDSRSRNFMDFSGASDNPDCNYQRWSSATESMSISTWNNTNERDRKSGTFIPNINRCRTRTSYIHVFGEYGRGDYAFTEPSGQAYLKDGSYVICDTNNHRIVYYTTNHEFIRAIGQPPNLPPLADEQDQRNNGLRNKGFTRQEGYLYFPNRVAICPLSQNIVATERPPSHDIQIFTVDGEFKRCFGGNILQHPRGVTVDEHGVIIVVECKVMKLVMFDQEGNFIVSHSLTKDLEFPNDVAAKADRIYISDNRGHCVQVFSYDAEFIMKIGFESVTYFPIGVSINFLNQLVVTDNHNTFNITVFDLNGKVMHIFESITKHAQCHNVAVHPSSLELMLTTKDCNVYFFNYDPNAQHPPPTSNVPRAISHPYNNRRGRGNANGNGSYY